MANRITIARMLLVIPFVFAFLANARWNANAALAILVVAATTDFLDGYLARRRGETSALGAALDPLADKLIVIAAVYLLTRNGVINGPHIFAALTIILREVLVSGLREAAARKGGAGAASLEVTALAKLKTAAQLIACGLLLGSAPNGVLGDGARGFGLLALWTAATLTAWTGAGYVRRAVAVLSRGR